MAKTFDVEMGKALCDRLGLGHDTTLREWKAEAAGTGMVAVSMTTMVMMSQQEYNELRQVAIQRTKEGTK